MAAPATCLVYVWLTDILGGVVGSVQNARLSVKLTKAIEYGNYSILPFSKSVSFDSSGYAQIQLSETQTPGGRVIFSIVYNIGKTVKQINFSPVIVPNSGAASLTSFASIN